MNIVQKLIEYLCLLLIVGYVAFTFQSAMWVYWRRGRYIHLEFAERRVKGTREPQRLRTLKRMRLAALLAIVLLIVLAVATAVKN